MRVVLNLLRIEGPLNPFRPLLNALESSTSIPLGPVAPGYRAPRRPPLDAPAVTGSASGQRYESRTRREASRGAALVVWPETAAPEDVVRKPAARQRAAKLAREAGVDILVGSFVRQQHGKQDTNSAVLFGQDGEIKGQYDKVSLVPFGEYLPLRPITRYLVPAARVRRRGVS